MGCRKNGDAVKGLICERVVGIEREGEEAQSHESGLDDTKDGVVCTRQCTLGVHFHCGRRVETKVSISLILPVFVMPTDRPHSSFFIDHL
jgi:hypothetical protein